MQHDIHEFNAVIAMTAVVTWLLMTLQGSMSFAFERDRSTLDALLTTPLAGRQIVLGKLAGIVRSSAFALGCPLLFIALAVMHQVMSWRAAALGGAIVVVTSVLAAAWGLLCSISTSTSVKAATYAFVVALVLLIGFPFAFGTNIDSEHRAAAQVAAAYNGQPHSEPELRDVRECRPQSAGPWSLGQQFDLLPLGGPADGCCFSSVCLRGAVPGVGVAEYPSRGSLASCGAA